MADFNQRFNPSYSHRATGYSDREATASKDMGGRDAAILTGSMLNKADQMDSSFPRQGLAQPSYMGSQSTTPDKQ